MNTTAIVLNWNTLNVAKDSIRRLKREVPVIVVDNGSTDGSREYFKTHHPEVTYILLDKNCGNSVARNKGIDLVKTKYYFLIDGDILYVPNSIKILEEVLDKHIEAGICGVYNGQSVLTFGFNGTPNRDEAEIKAQATPPYKGFPMAWTQYGLFRLTKQRFAEKPPFDGPGMGYEDSYFYHEMKANGLESYFIERPLYYHDAHSGARELKEAKLPTREKERREAFEAKWGKNDWLDIEVKCEKV